MIRSAATVAMVVATIGIGGGVSEAAISTANPVPSPPPPDRLAVVAQQLVTIEGPSAQWTLGEGGVAADEVVVSSVTVPTFLVMTSGAATVADVTPAAGPDSPVGDVAHLDAYEATFVRAGEAARVDADAGGAAYLALGLVGGSGGGPAGLPVGEAFTIEPGTYDVDLASVVIDPAEVHESTAAAHGPALVVVVSGTAMIGAPGTTGDGVTAGEARAIDGPLTITGAGEVAALVMVATVGPSLDEIALAGGEAVTGPATDTAGDEPTATTPTTTSPTTTSSTTTTMAAPDSDGDGLSDEEEMTLGTDPNEKDTDYDSLSDGDEVDQFGTDPLNPDTDNDMLRDNDELIFHTDPHNPDTDADGSPDHAEINAGSDPTDPDSDDDGFSDGAEYGANPATDPNDPNSHP